VHTGAELDGGRVALQSLGAERSPGLCLDLSAPSETFGYSSNLVDIVNAT
jgi:hypothetical protein